MILVFLPSVKGSPVFTPEVPGFNSITPAWGACWSKWASLSSAGCGRVATVHLGMRMWRLLRADNSSTSLLRRGWCCLSGDHTWGVTPLGCHLWVLYKRNDTCEWICEGKKGTRRRLERSHRSFFLSTHPHRVVELLPQLSSSSLLFQIVESAVVTKVPFILRVLCMLTDNLSMALGWARPINWSASHLLCFSFF